MKHIGEPRYGLLNFGIFGTKIVAEVVTGVRFTEGDPIYELSFGKDKWETDKIATSLDDIVRLLKIPSLQRIQETHGLKIKYDL